MHGLSVLQTGIANLYAELAKPGRFELGTPLMTPGASEALLASHQIPPEFLLPHKHGDWGELDFEDRRRNELALLHGRRLLSAYRTRADARLWVTTEWNRIATTLLLPEEN